MKELILFEYLKEPAKELLKRGVNLVGPLTGAYLSTLSNDPSAIVVSAAIGETLSQTMNDFSERTLSEKEKNNISLAQLFSIDQIIKNQESGRQINTNLFESNVSGNAEELYNGILIFAKIIMRIENWKFLEDFMQIQFFKMS